jgi:glycolate oxidase FAD binding subunit
MINTLIRELVALLGASHVAADPSMCSEYSVDEIVPAVVVRPSDAMEVAEVVRFAALEKLALIPCGNRTKIDIGMTPSRYDIAIDMTALNKIAHYDPGDFIISIDAGTNFNDFAVPLYQQKQFLPLSVPFYFESTIGGIVASGVDSSLRHSYGTVRDFLLGADYVDGTGSLCKSGGRVVKNVSGNNLHKLLVGSLGTLAVITRLNLRTFPVTPESGGLVASFTSAAQALDFSRLIAASPLTPTSVELVSPQLLQLILDLEESPTDDPPSAPLTGLLPENSWHLCISFDGTSEVCERYIRDLTALATQSPATNIHVLNAASSAGPDLWHHIGQAVPLFLQTSPVATIFKIVHTPSDLSALIDRLVAIAVQADLPHALLARASGVVYFALLPLPTSEEIPAQLILIARSIFDLCAKQCASAMLPWCPTKLKRHINIWGPSPQVLSVLRGIKSSLDPHNIFAPARLIPEI